MILEFSVNGYCPFVVVSYFDLDRIWMYFIVF